MLKRQLRHLTFCIVFLMSIFDGFSQTITGEIKSKSTGELLPFVSIAIGDTGNGVTSDINGAYQLNLPSSYQGVILVRNVGYHMQAITASDLRKNPNIFLEEDIQQLSEVVFQARENPANEIIRRTIKNRELHDPDRLRSHQFTSYAKEIYRLDPNEAFSDSLLNLLGANTGMSKNDSIKLQIEKNLRQRHIFVAESVSEVKYMKPGMRNETVLATNVSGFNSGLLAATGSSYQPLGFYKPVISMLGTEYVNPINPAGLSQYDFYIEDTLFYHGIDTVWVLSFEPKQGKKIDGFVGEVSIHQNDYAITHVVAENADQKSTVGLKIEQNYDMVKGQWFPVMQYTNWVLQDFKYYGHRVVLENYRYLSDISINPNLTADDFSDVSLSIQRQDPKKSIKLIEKKRPTALDVMELETFNKMDSISRRLRPIETAIESLFTQRYEVGKLDLRLNDIIGYNRYEKLRLGLGLETNDNLLKWFKVGGYGGYGTGDRVWKYGANMKFEFNRRNSSYLLLNYRHDLREVGAVDYFEKSYGNLADLIRSFQGNLFDMETHYKVTANSRVAPFTYAQFSIKKAELNPTYDYSVQTENGVLEAYDLNEMAISMRFARKERYVDLYGRKVATGVEFPIIKFRYAYADPSLLGGDFDYTRYDLYFHYEKKYRLGKTRMIAKGNYTNGSLPYSYLMTGSGNRDSYVAVWGFFQTMGRYEFLSDQYAALFLRHNFGNVLINSKVIKPELVVFHSTGIGELEDSEVHNQVEFKTMEQGYFEAGVGLKNLIRVSLVNLAYLTAGVEAHYRYGKYAFRNKSENLVFKVNVSYSL
ncbi:DUF5686 and carboxypeptidase-like regulatory domain-containing protein [Reichenbachiella versicolor]|uniref:DUF5686 and carboxypeptidase-like regulatory domain-containing protein n=1 Tax=Reichenbachiella versicolor TaxID=1821036 RepID=UPI000D6DEDA9|nr:DUF5686 and carboxypeptidase-like regulatory domain-containing protein [Reichenbachiella versicolor]